MKEFLKVLRRFVPPYKKYLVLSVVFNILSHIQICHSDSVGEFFNVIV